MTTEHARRRAVGPKVKDIIDGSDPTGDYIRALSAEWYDGDQIALSGKGIIRMQRNTENTNDLPNLEPTLFPSRKYLSSLSARRVTEYKGL